MSGVDWGRWRDELELVARSDESIYASVTTDGRIGSAADEYVDCRQLVFFKGSFDPVHNGHLALFEAALAKHSGAAGAFSLSIATAKREVPVDEVVERSRWIHLAGGSVVVSRSGRFDDNVSYFRSARSDFQLVFPIGDDVLVRLIEFYTPSEFEVAVGAGAFEFYVREGVDGPRAARYRDYSRVSELGANPLPAVSSSLVRELSRRGDADGVRGLMPLASADAFLARERERG